MTGSAALLHHHRTPSGLLLLVLVVLVFLYVGWRTGRLRRLRTGMRTINLWAELRQQGISPFSLIPLALLVIVVVVLLIAH